MTRNFHLIKAHVANGIHHTYKKLLHQKKTFDELDKEIPSNTLALMNIYFNFDMKHFVSND